MNTQKTFRTVLAIAVLTVAMLAIGARPAGAQATAGDDRAAALRILELVNRDRAQAGLPPLADRADVTSVAASWSAAMAQARVLSHNDGYFTAEMRQRLGAAALGENVARNGSVDDAHAKLMASPGHHANIMSTKYTVVGIAVYLDEGGTYWVTQNFMTPRTAPAAAPTPPPAPTAATTSPAPRRPSPVTGSTAPAAPAPAPAPAPPTTVEQQAAAAQADLELPNPALISVAGSAPSAGWGRPGMAPVATVGAPLGLDPLIVFAACANVLVVFSFLARVRRLQLARAGNS